MTLQLSQASLSIPIREILSASFVRSLRQARTDRKKKTHPGRGHLVGLMLYQCSRGDSTNSVNTVNSTCYENVAKFMKIS